MKVGSDVDDDVAPLGQDVPAPVRVSVCNISAGGDVPGHVCYRLPGRELEAEKGMAERMMVMMSWRMPRRRGMRCCEFPTAMRHDDEPSCI